MMEKAFQHLQAGDLAQAESVYRQIIKENPNNAEAMFMLAQVCQQQGDLDASLELLRQAETLEPFNPNIFHARGVLHINRKEPEDAERAFRAAIDINPTHVPSRNGLAFLDMAAGRFEAAEHAADVVLGEEPDNAQALTYKGTARLELGDPESAQAFLQEALKIQPEALTAQAQLGRAFLAAGNAAFAAQCFENALQRAPGSADLLEFLGRAQLEMGEVVPALGPLREAVSKGRANPDLFLALAACETAAGNPGQAEGLLAAALQMVPGRSDIVLPLAELLIARGATPGAIELLEGLKQAGETDEFVHVLLSGAHRRAGDSAAAIAAVESPAMEEAASDEIRLAWVQALFGAGRDAEAEEALEALLAHESPALGAELYRARRLFDKGDEAAISFLEELVVRPGLSTQQLFGIRRDLADALHRAGRYPEAAGQYGALAHRLAEVMIIDQEFDGGDGAGDANSTEEPAESAMTTEVTGQWPSEAPGDGRDTPIFVIGWPGSGQERVLPALAAHPELMMVMDIGPTQAERRSHIDRPRGATALTTLNEAQVQLRRSRYWKDLEKLGVNPETEQVLDAMWLTAESLPTIARFFPGAKIIVIQRDPKDMAVGWMQAGYRNLEHMAMAYRRQLELLTRCRESLKLTFVDIEYEAVLLEPETRLAEAVEALGLSIDDAVLKRFDEISMPVSVRQGDHRHYAPVESDGTESPGSGAVH